MVAETPPARWGEGLLALLLWTRFPVPELSDSRTLRLPIGDSLADDPGLYWITGPVMRLTGLDVGHAVWAIALAAFLVAVAVQRSKMTRFALIVSAPLYISAGGPYWISALAVWMALSSGPRLAGAIGLLVTPFRAAAGLPALAWSALGSHRSRSSSHRETARSRWLRLTLLAAGFVLVSSLGSHVLWHSIYIGLGWFPNPWGITYLDAAGMAATSAVYASPEYEAALRSLVIQHLLEQPAWFIAQLVAKLGAALALAFPWCLAIAFRRELWIPAALALAPMLATAPVPAYSMGLLALSIYGAAITLGFSAERVCQAAPTLRGNSSPLPAT